MKRQQKTAKPLYSFVIALAPYRNAEVIQYLKALNYPKSKYEIIVKKGLNPSENRNNGVRDAKGDIIVFIDDDAVVDENYLENVEKFFSQHKDIDIVGGPQLSPKDERGFAKISGFALSSSFGAFNVYKRYTKSALNLNADETDLTSANMVCKKSIFKSISFNPKLWPGEDPAFISEAKEHGFKVAYSPDIFVYHRRRASIKSLAKQIYSYGKTRPVKEGFIETLKRPYFLVPSAFLIYLLAIILLTIFSYTRLIIYFPLILYILLSFYTSLYISIREKSFLSILLLPIIFLTIHISYGLGIISGLVKRALPKLLSNT